MAEQPAKLFVNPRQVKFRRLVSQKGLVGSNPTSLAPFAETDGVAPGLSNFIVDDAFSFSSPLVTP